VDITNDDDVQVMRYIYMKPTKERLHAVVLMGNEWREGGQSSGQKLNHPKLQGQSKAICQDRLVRSGRPVRT